MSLMMLAHRGVEPAGRVHLDHDQPRARFHGVRQAAMDVVRGRGADGALDPQRQHTAVDATDRCIAGSRQRDQRQCQSGDAPPP